MYCLYFLFCITWTPYATFPGTCLPLVVSKFPKPINLIISFSSSVFPSRSLSVIGVLSIRNFETALLGASLVLSRPLDPDLLLRLLGGDHERDLDLLRIGDLLLRRRGDGDLDLLRYRPLALRSCSRSLSRDLLLCLSLLAGDLDRLLAIEYYETPAVANTVEITVTKKATESTLSYII
ncbi:hypothetical protein X975_00207, partial [Stegodyphus mimosarum]